MWRTLCTPLHGGSLPAKLAAALQEQVQDLRSSEDGMYSVHAQDSVCETESTALVRRPGNTSQEASLAKTRAWQNHRSFRERSLA